MPKIEIIIPSKCFTFISLHRVIEINEIIINTDHRHVKVERINFISSALNYWKVR